MLAAERQNVIRTMLLENKEVSVADLSKYFNVSFETIRRDLKVLENDGFAEKTYGGAVLRQRVRNTADFKTLENIMISTKERLASIAKRFIVSDDCIYIDFSTTCLNIARILGDVPLNVVSNSLEVLSTLSEKPMISVFSSAGFWDEKNRAFMGRGALNSLSQFHFDKAFISCRAISMEHGISDKTEQEADIRQMAIECSNEVYLVADHTKFDKTAFVRTAGFDKITALITDTPLNDGWKSFLAERSIHYYDFSTDFTESSDDEGEE
ncbi:DeoR/GlpR family DNA-binding transcription regulator [Ruthenibacterium lactatiformans]|uniref:DeoR/GlpR family DNA-binding transcription regulator n=1 Tax=Ruthenibacterium lactatiformans TaxID=1550024 RepID=UPI00307CBB86